MSKLKTKTPSGGGIFKSKIQFLHNLVFTLFKKQRVFLIQRISVFVLFKFNMQTKLLKIKLFCYQFFFLVIAAVCLPFPQEASAYPTYTANSDLVKVSPYASTTPGGTLNWGLDASGYREFLTKGQKYRM